MKIIFLDVDGVLNSDFSVMRGYEKRGQSVHNYIPHTAHVQWLNTIIKRTGAKCVLSSTWRKKYRHFYHFEQLMIACGFEGEIIGRTPTLHTKRGYEIMDWLVRWDMGDDKDGDSSLFHKEWEYIEDFIILDDDSDMLGLTDGHLVKTIHTMVLVQTNTKS